MQARWPDSVWNQLSTCTWRRLVGLQNILTRSKDVRLHVPYFHVELPSSSFALPPPPRQVGRKKKNKDFLGKKDEIKSRWNQNAVRLFSVLARKSFSDETLEPISTADNEGSRAWNKSLSTTQSYASDEQPCFLADLKRTAGMPIERLEDVSHS